MKTNRLIFWPLIILLLAANAFILIHRNEGYKYFPFKTYSQIYVTDSSLFLQDIHFYTDTVELSFTQKLSPGHYLLTIDDSVQQTVLAAGNILKIPVATGIHTYRLVPNDGDALTIILQLDHSKDSKGYTNELIFCNLPGPGIKVSSYSTWTKGIEEFSKDEVQYGKQFLAKQTKAFAANTDFARLVEVSRLISALRPNPRGLKAAEVSTQSPYRQLQLAQENKVNLDCGNYSAMIYFLCSVLNIPNRVVTFSGPDGNWRYGVHYYNEIYLREKQQWVLCDGVSNAYMPHDSSRFYNAADLYKIAHVNGFSGKYAYSFKVDSLIKANYDDLKYWHWYYNRNNANICYLHPGSPPKAGKWSYLKDFYSFNRDFDFYSDVNANDWLKIIIKMTVFYLLITVLVLYSWMEIKSRKRGG